MRTRLAVAVVGLAVGLLGVPASALAQRTAEPVPGVGAVGPLGLTFDAGGQGLFTWEGFDQQATPQRFTAVDLRDPTSGTWRRAPDVPGITWGGAAVYEYAKTHTLLIARQTSSVGKFNRARFRVVYSFGTAPTAASGRRARWQTASPRRSRRPPTPPGPR